jgi:hypothetical protein
MPAGTTAKASTLCCRAMGTTSATMTTCITKAQHRGYSRLQPGTSHDSTLAACYGCSVPVSLCVPHTKCGHAQLECNRLHAKQQHVLVVTPTNCSPSPMHIYFGSPPAS